MFFTQAFRNGFVVLVLLPFGSSSTCYWPDGSNANDYIPCNSTASASACCSPNDACTTFGWCLGASGMTYRGGCTTKGWNSPACMTSYCTNIKDDYQFLMNCNEGKYQLGETLVWCCSTNSGSSCCADNFSIPFTVLNGLTGHAFISDLLEPNNTVTTTVVGPAATGSSSTTAANQAASPSAPASSKSGVSTGAIAGAAVGCAIGGALLGAAIAFMLLRRKSKPTQMSGLPPGGFHYSPKDPYPGSPSNQMPVGQQYHPQPSVPMAEAPSNAPNYELDGQQHRR